MCGIVDAQVAHEVFGPEPSPAGREFYEWVGKAHGRLVVGGKLLEELEAGSPGFREWSKQAVLAGLVTMLDERKVDERTERIEQDGQHRSNDPHVLALAQLSRARLLFTNDKQTRTGLWRQGAHRRAKRPRLPHSRHPGPERQQAVQQYAQEIAERQTPMSSQSMTSALTR